MKLHSLTDLYLHKLSELLDIEQQLVAGLPMVAQAATNPTLRAVLEQHLLETKVHAERLESLLARHHNVVTGPVCSSMQALLKEGEELIANEGEDAQILDAGLVAAAQRIEHYEIASYSTACALAELMDDDEAKRVLDLTLQEEAAANVILTDLALSTINPALASRGAPDEGETPPPDAPELA
jgi:ferritin-like metal-binding protein YciE